MGRGLLMQRETGGAIRVAQASGLRLLRVRKPEACATLIAMAELPKRYDPNSVEPKWYQHWSQNQDFVADPESSKPAFSIVMPPPNIRSEEHTSELQSQSNLVCRLLLEKKNTT